MVFTHHKKILLLTYSPQARGLCKRLWRGPDCDCQVIDYFIARFNIHFLLINFINIYIYLANINIFLVFIKTRIFLIFIDFIS